jgi:dienelactone hydrolase
VTSSVIGHDRGRRSDRQREAAIVPLGLAVLLVSLLAGPVSLLAGPVTAQEGVSFPSRDQDLTGGGPTTLTGVLFRPTGPGPFPAVVLLHGCAGLRRPGGRLAARDEQWAVALRDQGYVALLPDSYTPRGVDEVCTKRDRPVRALRERPRDAYGALLHLQGLAFVRPDRVGLLGWSNGGTTVLRTVADDSPARPPALPAGDFRAAVAFYPGCGGHGDDWRTRAPLLVLVGGRDDWTPAEPCRALERQTRGAAAPVEVVVYPEAHHGFDAPASPVRVRTGLAGPPGGRATIGTDPAARADSLARVSAFLRRHLRD